MNNHCQKNSVYSDQPNTARFLSKERIKFNQSKFIAIGLFGLLLMSVVFNVAASTLNQTANVNHSNGNFRFGERLFQFDSVINQLIDFKNQTSDSQNFSSDGRLTNFGSWTSAPNLALSSMAGTYRFSQSSYTVGEATSTVTLTVTRSDDFSGTTVLSYATASGTATGAASCTAGGDYVNTSGTLTFQPEMSSQTIVVPVCNDSALESDETFSVALSISPTAGGGSLGSPSTATVTIVDNDSTSAGVLQFNPSYVYVSESAGTANVTVSRTGGSTGAVSVTYNKINGTATGGASCAPNVDFINGTGTLNFAAGQTTQTFSIPICNDTLYEYFEAFTVTLSNATGGATIGTSSTMSVEIGNDDQQPAVTISDVSQNEGNSGNTIFSFPITLSTVSGVPQTVYYTTSNGTATGGSDFVPVPSPTPVTIPAGSLSGAINVTVIGDTTIENDETFTVNLQNIIYTDFRAANESMAQTSATGTIINDDAVPCAFALNPTSISVPASGGIGNYTVTNTAGTNCSWSAQSNATLWLTSNSSGTGSGTGSYTIAANTNSIPRSGQILIGGQTINVTQAAAENCLYTISPLSQTVSAATETYGFNVVTNEGCPWSPQINNASWITTTTGVRVGSGTVNYTVQANENNAPRTGTITVQNKTFTVTQNAKNNPTYVISGRVVSSNGNSLNGVTVTLSGPLSRTAITDFNGVYQFGDLPPATYTVVPTIQGGLFNPRQVTISNSNVPEQNFSLVTCSYTLSQTATAQLPAGVSNVSFNVNTQGTCGWKARSNVPWIVIENEGIGIGNGTVKFVVQHNYNAVRSGTIFVNGQIFTVNQMGFASASAENEKINSAGACEPKLTNDSTALDRIVVPFSGGTAFGVNINTESNCQWTANDNVSWITTSSGGSARTGSGLETFTVQPMLIDDGNTPRIGKITVLGKEFTVIQTPKQLDDCNFNLSTTNGNYNLSGGSGSIGVNVGALCLWNAESVDNPWLNISGIPQGFGPATKGFTVKQNPGVEARTGTIIVGDKTYMVNQAAADAASCNYQLSSAGQTFSFGAETGSFTVASGAGCPWTAIRQASADWIIVTGGSGAGNGTVSFTLQPNTNSTQRTGTITISNKTYTVTQAGAQQACSYSISPGFQEVPNIGATGNIQVTANANCSTQWTAVSNADWISITNGANGTSGNGTASFVAQTNNTLTERTGIITIAGQSFTITQAAGTNAARVQFDFDGDKKADTAVFRPSTGFWYLNRSTSGFTGGQFGAATDKLAPGDFDGDGKTDLSVFRDSVSGAGNFAYFYITNSSNNSFRAIQFGATGDVPVPADWDGDGVTDLAVYRAGANNAQSYFYYRPSSKTGVDFVPVAWGSGNDKPAIGDYDGDGKADAAVFRPSNGVWYILRSSDAQVVQTAFGASTDIPVAADYDGDAKTDIAVFRPSNGSWYLQRSALGLTGIQFGANGDVPVAADYDGDGKADVSVFRNGTWFSNRSQTGFTGIAFGAATDKPIASAFIP